MSFKLIIATGYFAASSMVAAVQVPTPLAASIQSPERFEIEQACVDAATARNKSLKGDLEAAEQEIRKALAGPLEAVMARKKLKDMDGLKQADWREINAERKKITDAMPPIKLTVAFCVDADLWGRN